MGTVTSTSTLAPGASRTFNLAPASAVSLTLLPNCRVTVTETPAVVASSPVGGNAPRVHNLRYAGVVTYGPYAMGGTIVVSNDGNSGSTLTWTRTDALIAEDVNGVSSVVSGDGILSRSPLPSIQTVGQIGDSRNNLSFIGTNGVFHYATGDTVLANNGTAHGLTFFTGARLTHYNFAVAGATSQDVVDSQLADALAANLDAYSLIVGINDPFTGDVSLANVTTIVNAVRRIGKLIMLHTDMPNASASAGTLARMKILNEGVRALARLYPDSVILIDAKSAFSDPETSTGIAYSSASGRDLTYSTDDTHQNGAGGLILSYMQAQALRSRTVPFADVTYNGDTSNLLTNPAFSGVGGTKHTAGTGSLADSWTASREGIATTSAKYYKVWNPLTVIIAGDAPPLWNQCVVLGERRFTYAVIGVGTGTRAAITALPSSTTVGEETQPDGTDGGSNVGYVFLTLPAEDVSVPNPLRNQPFYWQYVEASNSSGTANNPVLINPTSLITSGFSVGDRLQASCTVRFLASAWQAFELSIACKNSLAAKTRDSFGPYYAFTNSQKMWPDVSGLCLTDPGFEVPADTTNVNWRFYIYLRANSVPARFMFARPTLRNLSV